MPHASLRWPIILSLAFGVSQPALNAHHLGAREHTPTTASRAQSKGEINTLRRGETIARRLSGEEIHSYLLPLAGGQLLSLSAEQRGVDIALTLYGPGGGRVAEGHSQFSSNISEPLSLAAIAETGGAYRLEVRAKKKGAAGSYEIKVEELREATPLDRRRLVALNVFAEGDHIRAGERALSSWQPVLEKYEASLTLFREIGDSRAEAETLAAIAWVHMAGGENRKALDHADQALALFRAAGGDARGEARVLRVAGWVHHLSGERQRALELLNQSLELYRTAGDRRGEGAALQAIGRVHGGMLECDRALEFSRRALALFREIGDRRAEATTLGLIGTYHEWTSEQTEALDHYLLAQEIFQSIGERRGAADMLDDVARIYNDFGERRKAIEYYKRAAALAQSVGELGAGVFTTVGNIYNDLGERRKALECYREALRLMRAAESPERRDWHHDEANTLVAAGRVHLSLEEKEKAFALFRQALERHTRALPRLRDAGGAWETKSLSDTARIYELLGQSDSALEHYGQALTRHRASNGRRLEYITLTEMAALYSSLGRHEEALAHHRQSLHIRLAVKDLNGAAESHYRIARIERERGQVEAARREIESAITIVESLRARIAAESLRASYFGTVQKYYEFYTDLLMRLHAVRPGEGFAALALQAHERSRARTMLETLVGARVDLREGVDPELVRRERGLRLRLNASAEKQMRLLSGSHTEAQAAAVAGEVEALTAEYETVEARIRSSSPRYAELVRPAPLTLKEIQTDILDNDTLLLEYALGSERSYLWLVAKDSLTTVELPARDQIEHVARRVQELLSDGEGWARGAATAGEYAKAAASLSRMLLPPDAFAARLGKKRLVVVADGVLQRLPFSALPAPPVPGAEPKPLVLEHEVISLPSATTLSLLRRGLRDRTRAPRGVAVLADPVFDDGDERVGRRGMAYAKAGAATAGAATAGARRADPATTRRRESLPTFPNVSDGGNRDEWLSGGVNITRLPFTRREAEAILAVAADGDELRALDFGASREAVVGDRLKDYRIVHFATHGLLNGEQPRSSGLVLSLVDERGQSVDGFLSLGEIYKLNLSAELVVLSACQTGLGKEVRGESLIGLVRGFMYAGAPRVVASLWKVDDRATAELMRLFYEGMLKEGLTPAAALRQAKVEMLASERWRAPFYWAAFELQGEWK